MTERVDDRSYDRPQCFDLFIVRTHTVRSAIATAALLLLPLCGWAQATSTPSRQCYQLVIGKQSDMCRTFEKNLNRFCNEPPMVCTPKVGREFADFSLPNWQSLDPAKHWDILEQLVRSRTNIGTGCDESCAEAWRDKQWTQTRPKLEEEIKRGVLKLDRAKVDLNHDGMLETVYRVVEGDCKPEPDAEHPGSAGLTSLMVYDEKTRQYDSRYAKYLKRRYDVLYFRGRAYLVRWDDVIRDAGLMIHDLYRNDNPSPQLRQEFAVSFRPLCEYRYKPE